MLADVYLQTNVNAADGVFGARLNYPRTKEIFSIYVN
jgi:hypothetical protein